MIGWVFETQTNKQNKQKCGYWNWKGVCQNVDKTTKLAKHAIKIFSKVWTRILFYPWTRTEKRWISQQVFPGSQSPLDNIKKLCKIFKSWIRDTTKINGVDQLFMSNLSFEIILFTLVKQLEFCPRWRDSSRNLNCFDLRFRRKTSKRYIVNMPRTFP